MPRYTIRPFESGDFTAIMSLEDSVFGQSGEKTLGPFYVRLCCDFFGDSCFLAEVDGEAVGYILTFLKGREAYCTTLAVLPRFHGTRVTWLLVRALLQRIADDADAIWFTVEESNSAARKLHAMLGAREIEVRDDFYGAGDGRIISRLDRETFEAMRSRYERMGLLPRTPAESSETTVASVSEVA